MLCGADDCRHPWDTEQRQRRLRLRAVRLLMSVGQNRKNSDRKRRSRDGAAHAKTRVPVEPATKNRITPPWIFIICSTLATQRDAGARHK